MKQMIRSTAFGSLLALADSAVAQSAVSNIADGQPWSMTASNGRQAEMVLNPDGSGQVRFGILRRNIHWTDEKGALCLKGTPSGDQCLVMTPQDGGFVGQAQDGGVMILKR